MVRGIGGFSYREGDGWLELSGVDEELLACLVSAGPGGAHRDVLGEALGLAEDPRRRSGALRTRASRLRSKLGRRVLPGASPAGIYRLALGVEQVDVWSLDDLARRPDEPVTDDDLGWALAGPTYGTLELSGGEDLPRVDLAQGRSATARAQRQVVMRYCDAAPSRVPFTTAERLRWFANSSHYDEDLVVRIADCLAGGGLRTEAVDLLEWFAQTLQADDIAPVESAALLERLRSTPPTAPATGRKPVPVLPPQLARLRKEPFVGRDAELDLLCSAPTALVLGPRGGGKSHLLAALAGAEIDRGTAVTYLAAQEDAVIDLAPFVTAFPEVSRLLPAEWRLVDDADDRERMILLRIANAVFDHLEARSPAGGVHRVLVDDAQWLDRRSAGLVQLLVRGQGPRRLTVTVAGRNDERDQEWLQFQQRLERDGAVPVELAGLGPDAIYELIGARHRATTDQARRALAIDLLGLTGGLPWPLCRMIDEIDPETFTLPASIGTVRDLPGHELDDLTRSVGLAAAVLGLSFHLDDVIALAGRSRVEVEDAIDRLILLDVVAPAGGDDRFSFHHVLVQESFLAKAPTFLHRRLNLAAAERSEDIHARARYLVRAGRPFGAAVDALRESGAVHAGNGNWWSATSQYRQAEALDPSALDAEDYTLFAGALDLSGQDGTAARRRGFDLAVADGRWDLALAAAVSALPAAERPDGDPERLRLLLGIVRERLGPAERFTHALHLARGLALNGSGTDALVWADQAVSAASDPDQRALAHISQWTTRHHLVPDDHPFPADVAAGATGVSRLRLLQMQAISDLEAGRTSDAIALHRTFRDEAIALADPLRVWHAMCFDVLLAFDAGRWGDAAGLADRAFRYGARHDLQEATIVHRGQQFQPHYLAGSPGALLRLFESIPANVGRSNLAMAMLALALAAADRPAEALDLAVEAAGDALDRRRSASLPTLALLSPLISESGDEALRRQTRSALLPFADSSLVVGFGVANLGPLWRYLVPLADGDDERLSWLHNALDRSTELDSPCWKVLNGQALADACDDDVLRAETRRWAAGTDIGCIGP